MLPSQGSDGIGENCHQCVADDDDNDVVLDQAISGTVNEAQSVLIVKNIGMGTAENGEANVCLSHLNDDSRQVDKSMADVSGTKSARTPSREQQPSVRVIYSSLTRSSKRKLEELMQTWSQWHANFHSSSDNSDEVLEFGEGVYFPALHVGSEKSVVPFWMDNQARPEEGTRIIQLDNDSIPRYDRGYSLGLTSNCSPSADGYLFRKGIEAEANRCFNCGSYNHSFKECSKPLDSTAVNSARKLHSLKRKQAAGPRFLTRYYQNSPGGKFEGLKPGILSPETRQWMGIGELDPPPWSDRMRAIGCSPACKVEDEPSGITIFSGDERTSEAEEGEFYETPETYNNKLIAGFERVNSLSTVNADERWVPSPSPRSNFREWPVKSTESKGVGDCLVRGPARSRDGKEARSPGSGSSGAAQSGGKDLRAADASTYGHRHRRKGCYSPGEKEYHGSGSHLFPRSPALERSLSDRSWRSHLAPVVPRSQYSYPNSSPRPPLNSTGHASWDFDRWVPSSHHGRSRDSWLPENKRHENHRPRK